MHKKICIKLFYTLRPSTFAQGKDCLQRPEAGKHSPGRWWSEFARWIYCSYFLYEWVYFSLKDIAEFRTLVLPLNSKTTSQSLGVSGLLDIWVSDGGYFILNFPFKHPKWFETTGIPMEWIGGLWVVLFTKWSMAG